MTSNYFIGEYIPWHRMYILLGVIFLIVIHICFTVKSVPGLNYLQKPVTPTRTHNGIKTLVLNRYTHRDAS